MITSPSFHLCRYGAEALERLGSVVAELQSGDPLAGLTIIVPSHAVGVNLRHWLARHTPTSAGGVAGIETVTPLQLVRRVNRDETTIDQLTPVSGAVLASAVRRVLQSQPGRFGPVAAHEATEVAVAAMFAELDLIDEAGLEAIASEGGRSSHALITMFQAIREELIGFCTEADEYRHALEQVDLDQAVRELGPLVWFLPNPLPELVGLFIGQALQAAEQAHVIVGVSGLAEADAAISRTLGAAALNAPLLPEHGPTRADRAISVSDPREEIRWVSAEVLALLEHGVPAHRIGVFYSAADPYLGLLTAQLDRIGLPAHGPETTRLIDTAAARLLLGLLSLPTRRWRRAEVIAILAAAPIAPELPDVLGGGRDEHDESGAPPPTGAKHRGKASLLDLIAIDRATRHAGVAEGLHDWRTRLANVPQALHTPSVAAIPAVLEEAAERIAALQSPRRWAQYGHDLRSLLDWLIGPARSEWPEEEREGLASLHAVLRRLERLDALEPRPELSVVLRVIHQELTGTATRRGRIGEGLVYGPMSAAVGLDLDAVFIVGLADGMAPARVADQALLSEAVRAQSLNQLDPLAARISHQRLTYEAALASAPPGRRVVTIPRVDGSGHRHTTVSRWLEGEMHDAVNASAVTLVAPTIHDEDLRLGPEQANVVASAGLVLQSARLSNALTAYDGLVEGEQIPRSQSMSASRLETWAKCGFRYFLGSVLELDEREDPALLETIDGRDRGSAVHDVLEQFIKEAIEEGPPSPTTPWSPKHHQRIQEIATDVFASYEQRGRTGRHPRWQVEQLDLRAQLDRFLHADAKYRASYGVIPHAVEWEFSNVVVAGVELHGFVDRIDRHPDGSIVVLDYKTGQGKAFRGLKDDDFVGGTVLQLGVYAEAARQLLDAPNASAYYVMVEADPIERLGYAWTPPRQARFESIVSTISSGITQGMFAADPLDCGFCPFDAVCPSNRVELAERKAGDHRLSIRTQLIAENEGTS